MTDAARIPPSALTVHAVRVSGPGGQSVNKVRDEGRAARRPRRGGGATRNQIRNLEDGRAKVADLVRAALAPLRRRVKTGPPVSARRRRLTGKKRRGAVKCWRFRPDEND